MSELKFTCSQCHQPKSEVCGYIDVPNGIGTKMQCAIVCDECLMKHVAKHYPGSPNHRALLAKRVN